MLVALLDVFRLAFLLVAVLAFVAAGHCSSSPVKEVSSRLQGVGSATTVPALSLGGDAGCGDAGCGVAHIGCGAASAVSWKNRIKRSRSAGALVCPCAAHRKGQAHAQCAAPFAAPALSTDAYS